jgi:arginyl-tRNA synthetase
VFFYSDLVCHIKKFLVEVPGIDSNIPISLMPPEQETHGDLTTPIAFQLAKCLRKAPSSIAQDLAIHCAQHPWVASASALSGFVNLTLKAELYDPILKTILKENEVYGFVFPEKRKKVNIEFVSANPTGPLHAGHTRIAAAGDALARLMQAGGYDVTREYYINDAGHQIDVLCQTVTERYTALCEKRTPVLTAGDYPGEYLQDVAQTIYQKHSARLIDTNPDERKRIIRRESVDYLMQEIRKDLEQLNIHYDLFVSEQSLIDAGKVDAVIQALTEKGWVYEGELDRPKGQESEDWQPVPLLLFRSSAFGDDQDRPLKKADGTWTYFASDIAYHFDKFERGFDQCIDVWGADHASHVVRMQAALEALGKNKNDFSVMICQIVNFYNQGVALKMSKREGTFITLRDILSYIDANALRFMMISKKADSHFDFDFELAKQHHKDNPVFYVQYAYARASSVLRGAQDLFPDLNLNHHIETFLQTENRASPSLGEYAFSFLKLLADWPRVLKQAAEAQEPHRITHYLYKVACAFHGLWQSGKSDAALRFLHADNFDKTTSYLFLLYAMKITLSAGFSVLGIDALEEM